MSNRTEIQKAIEALPQSEIDALRLWLVEKEEPHSTRLEPTQSSEAYARWLQSAAGAGRPGVTVDEIMQMTRGED
jgi:hypothetical protein